MYICAAIDINPIVANAGNPLACGHNDINARACTVSGYSANSTSFTSSKFKKFEGKFFAITFSEKSETFNENGAEE